MQCPRCRTEQPDGLNFCGNCGTLIAPPPGNAPPLAVDRQALAVQIGQLEAGLAQSELDLQKKQGEARKQTGCATWAAVFVLVGAGAFFFLGGLWSMGGAVLGIASLLACVLSSLDQVRARRAAEKAETELIQLRGQLGELRARMML